MADTRDQQHPSTPPSVEAVAQTSEAAPASSAPETTAPPIPPEEAEIFQIGDGVTRAIEGRPYERKDGQPLYRPLKIFALDPSVSRLEGATALVNVPYEQLQGGPEGRLFKVAADDGGAAPLDLDDHNILLSSGLDPSTSDKRFQDQMVYAVSSIVYTAFRQALGRHITWGFEPRPDRSQLLLKPRAFEGTNSFYDKAAGEVSFGFYKSQAKDDFPGNVYACLSHDAVAHEVTHAMLDGLRAHFSLPTSADVLAFHEGFADVVAVFQHFSYEQVVRAAIRNSRGSLTRAALLTDIARQLGQTRREAKTALRSALDFSKSEKKEEDGDKEVRLYDPTLEPHDLGSVLVFAVFRAFITVFRRKTERLVRLATNGSGRLPPGELPADLQAALAEKASKLAGQFLTMCIRAIDYCPPVDMTLGEYLRAVITADKDLVPDDRWAYREAWIDSFRIHHIYPSGVSDLSEDSVLWTPLKNDNADLWSKPIEELAFRELKFNGDPAWPADANELTRQARALGKIVTTPEFMKTFGLAQPGDPLLKGDEVLPPKIQSIRSSRRVGPSGQIVFDIVAEVTQKRKARFAETGETCTFYGGSTVIIDPDGRIRYTIVKNVTNNRRLNEQKQFLDGPQGSKYKPTLCGDQTPNFFMLLHEEENKPNA